MIENLDFYQTNKLLPRFQEFKEGLKADLSEQDFLTLWRQVEHFLDISQSVTKITRKTYTSGNESGFYFLFAEETKFTNWDEFKEIFDKNHTIFFSNHEEKSTALLPDIQEGLKLPSTLIHVSSL